MSYFCAPPPSDSDDRVVSRLPVRGDRSQSDSSRARRFAPRPEYGGWCGRAVIVTACCLTLLISACGYDVNASSNSTLIVSPNSVNFGTVPVGQTASSKVSLSNQGLTAVDVAQLSVAGQTFYLDSQTNLPVTIAPGGTYSFAMGFKPSADTSYSGEFTVMNSEARRVAQGSLSGAGVANAATGTATLSVSPASLTFGNVTVGTTSTLPVTLTSTGTSAVTIHSVKTSGIDFTVSGATFPLTLNPQQKVTLQVQFASMMTGAATGTLTVRSNSSTNATATINLNGTGVAATSPQLTMSFGSLTFGNVAVGSSATLPVTLTSTGSGPVNISAATISGTGFTISGATFPMTLNPQKSVTLNVKFTPTAASAATGTLSISSNAVRHHEIDIGLSGKGTNSPVLTVSPSTLSFGNVAVGSSPTQTVTLTSSGKAAVKVNSATISGTGFTVSGSTFPVTLNPKQTLTLTVKFAPTASGAMTGTLTINSTSSMNPTTSVSLSGTGTTSNLLTVSPGSLAFGNVAVGSSPTQTVTLTSSGTAAVKVNSATISGTGFTVSGSTFPVTLNPKQTLTLTVKFAPTASGAVTGALTINSTSSTNPTTLVSLSGTGTTSLQLTLSPSSLSFGDVMLGSSATLPVTLTSSGTTAVAVSSAAVSGTGFTVSGATFPVTLNPNQAVTLTVKYAPTTGGAVTGKLTITSNSSTNPTANVSLSGTGMHSVKLSWQAPTSSPVQVTGYNIYKATAGSSSYQLLSSTPSSQLTLTDSNVVSGTAYSYYVESVDSAGAQSGPSNVIKVTVPTP